VSEPVIVEDTTVNYRLALVNLKVWDGVPEYAQRDLKAFAHEIGARLQDEGLSIGIEVYPLRDETIERLRRAHE
jgi:hypothetical protein